MKTKAPVTVSEYGEKYCLIGPYNGTTAPMEVETIQKPANAALDAALTAMRAAGVYVVYGRWLIEGAPHVLLFDVKMAYSRMNEWKSDLWNTAGLLHK